MQSFDEFKLKLNLEGGVVNGDTFDHASKTSLEEDTLTRRNQSFTFVWEDMGKGGATVLKVIGPITKGKIDLRLLAIHVFMEVATMYMVDFNIVSEIEILNAEHYSVDVEVFKRD